MATKDTAASSGKAQEQAVAAAKAFAVSTAAQAASKKEVNTSGFYCYIGPSLRGLIRHGNIFRGSRADALKAAAAAIEAQPLVKALIVSGDALPDAYQKVKTPGSALYRNCQCIAGKV